MLETSVSRMSNVIQNQAVSTGITASISTAQSTVIGLFGGLWLGSFFQTFFFSFHPREAEGTITFVTAISLCGMGDVELDYLEAAAVKCIAWQKKKKKEKK